MEAIGTALAGIQLADRLIILCGQYISEVKGAKKEIEKLRVSLMGTKSALESVKKLFLQAEENKTETVNNLLELVTTCEAQLASLSDRLDQVSDHKSKFFGRKRLKWPFERNEVGEVIERLEQGKSSILVML